MQLPQLILVEERRHLAGLAAKLIELLEHAMNAGDVDQVGGIPSRIGARIVCLAHERAAKATMTVVRPQLQYPYDVSKAATDLLARCYWYTWRLPVAVTRFANLYGGGDVNASRLVPEAVAAALTGRPPIVRSDGSPERDFLYVDDAVAAYLAIWAALGRGEARGEALNAAETDRQWVDYGKLHKLTGSEPRIDLEEGLRRTIEWHRAHAPAST